MRQWLIGGGIVAATVLGTYLVYPKPQPPDVTAGDDISCVKTAGEQPAVLPEVIDVADLTPLLDPPAAPAAGSATGPVVTAVGMEPPAEKPAPPAADVTPIPPAADDEEPGEQLAADEPEVEVAPPPREVTRAGWEDAFQPRPGPVLLDAVAVEAIPEPGAPRPDLTDTFIPVGVYNFPPPPSFLAQVKANPLGPLFVLNDAELLRQRVEPARPARAAVPVADLYPASVWVPTPVVSDSRFEIVRRAGSVFRVPAQAPASRVEWFVNWYGEARLPRQLGPLFTPEQVRDGFDSPPHPLGWRPNGSGGWYSY